MNIKRAIVSFAIGGTLIGCSSYGPSMTVTEKETTNYDTEGNRVSMVVEKDIEGKQAGVALVEASDTQSEVSANWRTVELKKMEIFTNAQTCTYPEQPIDGFKGVGDAESYYEMVDNALDGCKHNQAMLSMAFATDQLGDNIQEASGVGSLNTQVTDSAAQVAIAAEQGSASKHATWGKVTVSAIGIWGLTNASNGWAQAAGAGGATVFAANGSRVNYSEAGNAQQYKDGVELTAIGDKSTATPQTDGPVPGSSNTENSASGPHEGNITTNNSPIFFMNDRLSFQNLEPNSTGVFDNSAITTLEGSNDNVNFGGTITGSNESSPTR